MMIHLIINKMQTAVPKSELRILRQSTGLVKDKKNKELTSLMMLFNYTLSEKDLSIPCIINKMKCFALFCLDNASNSPATPFIKKVSSCYEQLKEELANDQLLYSALLTQIFSILFQYRINVYQVCDGQLTIQKFGKSHFKRKIKLLLTETNLILLKKRKLSLKKGKNTFVINGNLTKEKLTSNIEDLAKLKTSDTLRTTDTQKKKITKRLNVMNYLNCQKDTERRQEPSKETVKHTQSIKTKNVLSDELFNKTTNEKPKPISNNRFTGRLKFFINKKDYGFIKMNTGEEIFLHKLDLIESNINVTKFVEWKKTSDMLLEFSLQSYKAKNKIYQKAIEIVILETRSLL